MTNIYMLPTDMSLGIGRVVSAYRRHLPDHGFVFVDKLDQADLVVMHAGEQCDRPADITHNHGLYPTATHMPGMEAQNARVIHNLKTSRIVTVPSQWVADQVRRNMLFDPFVVPHGIEPDEFEPIESGNYILWAKGIQNPVCDPTPVNEVAAKLPQYRFVTTFGHGTDNVTVIGPQKYRYMKEYLHGAGMYLATTKETFGVQTLEAMACGVPIVGWSWGCTPDIVGDDVGLLSAPRDIDALAENIDYMMQHRHEYRTRCEHHAKVKYSWKSVVEAYLVPLYNNVSARIDIPGPDVSVVITSHNYEQWVGDAIQSAIGQNYNGDVEIIVVDDASTDNSLEKIRSFGTVVRLISIKDNVGAAMARNIGIRHANAPIIASLDADDKMLPNHLSSLVPLVNQPGVGIAYGRLVIEDRRGHRNSDWPIDFNFRMQAVGRNCVPSASVFKKEAWKRVGGYSSRFIRGEDAEFWLRIASIGYDVKYANVPVYVYRFHGDSISTHNEEPDWVGDKPWSSDPLLTPFAAPVSGYGKDSYPVYEYDDPWVAVVIPVGLGHETIAWRAVESVMKQSLLYWECIVVNDSGKDLIVPATGESLQATFPFVRIVDCDARNVSTARNAGALVARAGLLTFLDADDAMRSHYLRLVIDAYRRNPDNYIYTDWMDQVGNSSTASEFSCELLRREALHPVTALVPRVWHDEIGGFDPDMPGWEDWEYYLRLSAAGYCGLRVPQPLVVYDYSSGVRRDYSREMKLRLQGILKKKYRRDNMACNSPGCKKQSRRPQMRRPQRGLRGRQPTVPQSNGSGEQTVMVSYALGSNHKQGVRGRATRVFYGKKKGGDVFEMHIADQRLQPQLYKIVGEAGQPGPIERVAAPPVAPIPPVPHIRRVNVMEELPDDDGVVDEQVLFEAYEPIHDDEQEIDIATMSLRALKGLQWDPDTALTALEVEREGRRRKNVLEYLEMKAAPAIAKAAKFDHEYAEDDDYSDDDYLDDEELEPDYV